MCVPECNFFFTLRKKRRAVLFDMDLQPKRLSTQDVFSCIFHSSVLYPSDQIGFYFKSIQLSSQAAQWLVFRFTCETTVIVYLAPSAADMGDYSAVIYLNTSCVDTDGRCAAFTTHLVQICDMTIYIV